MTIPIRNQKAFTLVELLVVIAIIAILLSMIAVSLKEASERGKNTKIITDVVQVMKIAEQIRLGGSYTSLCKDSTLNGDDYADLATLREDITKYGSAISCYASDDSYCVSAALAGEAGNWFCIDDEGNAIKLEQPADPCADSADTCQ